MKTTKKVSTKSSTGPREKNVSIVVCEYTGNYEQKLLVALADAGIDVYAANPLFVRYFAKSKGVLHKTDKADAKIIAQFAQERRPKPMRQKTDRERALKEFVTLRRQLVRQCAQFKNQGEHAIQDETKSITEGLIKSIKERIKTVENTMETLIKENSDWKKKKEILESIPGIGPDTIRTLLADLPELGEGSAEKISALVGLPPKTQTSGKWKGKQRIQGGRINVRVALHNAAIAATLVTKKDNIFKGMYERLTKEMHKPHKVALVAVSHKMIKIAHTLLKNGTKWKSEE
ncbi:MAG: IS110 family transposase [Planctomycetaceae bacterium]|nr:IS110 family transposase [Planctomycetaceae bacterium]